MVGEEHFTHVAEIIEEFLRRDACEGKIYLGLESFLRKTTGTLCNVLVMKKNADKALIYGLENEQSNDLAQSLICSIDQGN